MNFLTNGIFKNFTILHPVLSSWNLHFACMMTAFSNTRHPSVHLYTCLASLYDDGTPANSSPSKDGPEEAAGPLLCYSEGGGGGYACIISEHAQSSGRCRDCPHWLRSPSSGGVLRCQRTLMAATFPFSHSPVLFLELLPPAGRPSLFSTSSFCSGTTPSPRSGQKMPHLLHLGEQTVTKNIQEAIRKPYCLTTTFSKSLAAVSTAAIMCARTVPSATWRLPVFPWLNSLNCIYVSQIDD